jgi:hypothetical protein
MFGGTLLAVTLVEPIVALGKDSDKAGTQTVTGCLAQGDEANEYSIKAEDGKTYGLRSSEIKLADHLNHKVTVTGKVTPEKHSGKVDAKTGKREEDAHMKVSNLTMVSPTCP